ncbi:MAG: DnaJ-class molecular chaperone with C-terminal Zn finger domain [Phormidesmis priestleyi Ana]|uniref:DnaJ-class molecular chaperone with C-terminal Zn finger domain n=1 Tax=Phormidesmis priestleyi Ana TaxID=1666911 RepID=A0A0P8DFD1_9CYAN|nr:MAG: DnaJ-class molecular chaperone with C-terminal Zn finger domain [Phormidesmis priestleyi Ana]
MRIPLDYYRILGLPIQATAEQLKQSHRDRILQVPRREYSELAIEARRQLIDKAYEVLSDSLRRTEYDQAFLAASKNADTVSLDSLSLDSEDAVESSLPTIEIENQQLVGALLILLELGEYELVLRLGRPYLKRDVHSPEGQQIKTQPDLPDIILTLAVACLELGREEWQQNHYEHAAESLETGRELLLKEDLFPVLRAEIQADLFKLRPYRCLELIARPLEQKQSRQEGVNLLRGMLQDRGGIDGAEDDLSGLGVDDFLRFVQQLRGYLTAAEQQEVFEAEAQRPSAVGTYLAVYALLARGFAQHQPALIQRAKQMLLRLSGRQDVHLEQAVCAVLLGQTEEASHALELSQEYDPLAFIREHSQGSPDLLPGLCLYAENWLQQEVFPFFRDLDQEPATLKDYFADSTVQSYLENLPLENERNNRQSSWSARSSAGYRTNQGEIPGLESRSQGASALLQAQGFTTGNSFETSLSEQAPSQTGFAGSGFSSEGSGYGSDSISSDRAASGSGRFGAAGVASAIGAAGIAGASGIAAKISQLSPTGQLGSRRFGSSANTPTGSLPSRPAGGSVETIAPSTRGGRVGRDRRGRRGAALGGGPSEAQGALRSSPKWGRLALVGLAGLAFLVLGLILLRSLVSLVMGGSDGATLRGEQLDITINEPPIEMVEAEPAAETVAENDAQGIADATISQWLEVKQAAYAAEYDTSGLETVLAGQLLSDTQQIIEEAKRGNVYTEYTYDQPAKILSVVPEDATGADRLTVEAEITEAATIYENGASTEAYSDSAVYTYTLIRENDRWLILDVE